MVGRCWTTSTTKKILGFAADIPRRQRLTDPDGSAVAHSRLCGSKVTVDVKMEGSRVADFGHEVKACALGQASSSIMARMSSARPRTSCTGSGTRCMPC